MFFRAQTSGYLEQMVHLSRHLSGVLARRKTTILTRFLTLIPRKQRLTWKVAEQAFALFLKVLMVQSLHTVSLALERHSPCWDPMKWSTQSKREDRLAFRTKCRRCMDLFLAQSVKSSKQLISIAIWRKALPFSSLFNILRSTMSRSWTCSLGLQKSNKTWKWERCQMVNSLCWELKKSQLRHSMIFSWLWWMASVQELWLAPNKMLVAPEVILSSF